MSCGGYKFGEHVQTNTEDYVMENMLWRGHHWAELTKVSPPPSGLTWTSFKKKKKKQPQTEQTFIINVKKKILSRLWWFFPLVKDNLGHYLSVMTVHLKYIFGVIQTSCSSKKISICGQHVFSQSQLMSIVIQKRARCPSSKGAWVTWRIWLAYHGLCCWVSLSASRLEGDSRRCRLAVIPNLTKILSFFHGLTSNMMRICHKYWAEIAFSHY